jgi:hypothetical protein
MCRVAKGFYPINDETEQRKDIVSVKKCLLRLLQNIFEKISKILMQIGKKGVKF